MENQARIIDGKKAANKIRGEIVAELSAELKARPGPSPRLAVILVGNDPASQVYVRQKRRACESVGIESVLVNLPEQCTQNGLNRKVKELNKDRAIHGILLQLPLPFHLSRGESLSAIMPEKDVDGLTPHNQGCVQLRHPGLYPCTPLGVMHLLEQITDIRGKKIAVIGYSILAGAPLTAMLVNAGATVLLCNEFSSEPEKICSTAEIVVAAAGVKGLVDRKWLKPGAVVIDVGIHRHEGSLTGDVKFHEAAGVASWITPVPGGVGPVTVAMLLKNCVKAWMNQTRSGIS